MKPTKIIFLRHAETLQDPLKHPALWELSDEGKRQAEEVSKLPIMNEVDVIYASTEKKTYFTAEPLAKRLDKEILSLSFFDEVKRGDKFLTKNEFEKEKDKQLTDLNYHAFGGESGQGALTRFKAGVEKVSKENKGKTILVVTHGTIMNIYFADLLRVQGTLPQRWQKTSFCAYGVLENGKVVRDII